MALRALYLSTSGQNWTAGGATSTAFSEGEGGREGEWLKGEPCVDEWYGLTCCPAGYKLECAKPYCEYVKGELCLQGGSCLDKCIQRDADGRVIDSQTAASYFNSMRLGLASGATPNARMLQADDSNSSFSAPGGPTGASLCGRTSLQGRALCNVVAVNLNTNGLVGSLNATDGTYDGVPSICYFRSLEVLNLGNNKPGLDGPLPNPPSGYDCLPELTELDLRDNDISGIIPTWVVRAAQSKRLNSLNLDRLALEYPATDAERKQSLQPLITACRDGGLTCQGLPPDSCDAFRSQDDERAKYQPKTDKPGECIACRSLMGPILLLTAFLILCAMGIGIYIWLINKYGKEFLTKWVSTVGIFLNHIQTLVCTPTPACVLRLDAKPPHVPPPSCPATSPKTSSGCVLPSTGHHRQPRH